MIGANKKASIGGERACTLTAVAIADIVGGELRGDPATTVSGVCPLDRATADDVSFASQARYAPMFRETKAGVVLVTSDLADTPSPERIGRDAADIHIDRRACSECPRQSRT